MEHLVDGGVTVLVVLAAFIALARLVWVVTGRR